MAKRDILRRGKNTGALIGGVIYLIFGLLPSLQISSYLALVLLARLPVRGVESELIVRVVMIAGDLVGVLLSVSLFVVSGAVSGILTAHGIYSVSEFLRHLSGEVPGERPVLVIKKREPLLPETISQEIEREMAFLNPYLNDLYSIILIGSTAYSLNEEDSDIDMAIISKKRGFESVRDAVFEHEMDLSLKKEPLRREFIVLEPDYTEELFRISSPFSFSIRYGRVLWDDGFLEGILKRYHPSLPSPEYYFKAFHEYIATQYYGSLTRMERDIKERNCSTDCCKDKKNCEGHTPVDMFLKVILRMLYITLPAKGYIPLTKRDIVEYVKWIYGRNRAEVVEEIINLSRRSTKTLYYDQYLRFKPVATSLFRETLEILGRKAEVTRVLRDAANMVRGNYQKIQDRAFRECVI
jgi:predicted nucleotidyltransferase